MSMVSFATSTIVAGCLALCPACPAVAEDTKLFDFAEPSSADDWVPVKLPGLESDQPAPKVEIVANSDEPESGKCLKITFDGGDWPAISTTKISVAGNWKPYETLKADLTVDRTCVAYFRVCQGSPEENANEPGWQKTMILQPGRNEVTLTIRRGLARLHGRDLKLPAQPHSVLCNQEDGMLCSLGPSWGVQFVQYYLDLVFGEMLDSVPLWLGWTIRGPRGGIWTPSGPKKNWGGKALKTWEAANLGSTIPSQRKKAFSKSTPGTKTGTSELILTPAN